MTPENRIWHLRKARSLTQRVLAEKVGTSQQQIQRIEAGVIAVRLDLAVKIANALGTRLGDVFPKLAKAEKKRGRRKAPAAQVNQELSNAGIDPDPRHWTVKFFTRDGRVFLYGISSSDKDRLESIVSGSRKMFLVFNSNTKCVAVNRTKIAACQFLFDIFKTSKPEEEGEEEFKLNAHLVGTKEAISFDLEPDGKTPEEDDYGSQSQLQMLFVNLEGVDEDEVVWFDDADGERVYVRTSELLLLEVPLVCCEPALWERALESLAGEEGEGEGPIPSNAESKS